MWTSRVATIALLTLTALLAGGVGGRLPPSRGGEKAKAGDPKADIVLPKDPNASVLTFDPGAGGFIRKGPPPYLRIQADGRVTVVSPFDGSKKESKVTAKQLQDLLRFVIRENDFFNLSAAKIAGAIKDAAGKGPFIAVGGAGTAVIGVQADGKRHEVGYRAAGAYLRAYPKVRVLAQFVAIEKRLSELARSVAKGK